MNPTAYGPMTDGFLCGWRVHSELHLPELAPWTGDDRPPDLVIRIGKVPDRLDDLALQVRRLQIDRRGRCLLRPRNIADFLVNGPSEIVVAPSPGASQADIRVFLLGSVFGFICHLRGLFPLHASSVAIAGKAAAFCGPTGAGKSTTATRLALRGHLLLADDVTVIDARAPGGPQVLPAFPRMKLTRTALDGLRLPAQEAERDRLGGQEKYHYSATRFFSAAPMPLGGIFLLRRVEMKTAEQCVRLSRPAEILAALAEEVFRPHVAAALGRDRLLLGAQSKVAETIPVWRLSRRFDLSGMDRWIEQIEARVKS